MGVSGQHQAPAALPPGKTRYPTCVRLGGPQDRSGRVRKTSPHNRFRSSDRPARNESLYRIRYPDLCKSRVHITRPYSEWPVVTKENHEELW